jgi:hypothetical protein
MLTPDGAFLMLKTNRQDATQFIDSMKPGKTYQAELKEHQKKRSLDANALAWKLLGDLSAVLRIPPEDIYRSYIRDVGGNYEIVPVKEDHIEDWDRVWCKGHYGRSTEDMGECRKIPGYHYIKSYIGSSDYDVSQMSRLLDLIITDCKAMGVDVLTERERTLLLEDWGDKK